MKEGIANHLFEVQDVTSMGGSGLTFEFRFESAKRAIEFDTVVSGSLRILFYDILVRWLVFSAGHEEHFCFFLSTGSPTYDCKTLKFKSAFRLVLAREVRFFVFQRVWKSMDMKELFINKLNYRTPDYFIRFSRTAPAPLLGTCEIGLNEPLYLDSVLRIDIDGGKTDGDSVTLGSIENRFPNTVNELSINYPVVGGAVVKDRFTTLKWYVCQQALNDDDRYRFQMARDDAYATFIKESTVDPALRYIHAMIGMLSARRFRDAAACNEILLSLAATRSSSRRFYCVVVMVALDHTSNLTT
ncbi:hypothetical protein PI125_g19881 [Phytophthora idaei]|nr:hypothetical protein PI125_g19881 [Phytophthora idaei]KAG3135063.1 hypothetical protein PI126_g18413 [Phytophthora idaei]